jgi:hypothetical protein
MLGEGWLELEASNGERARWMGERAHIYVEVPQGGTYRLEFTAQAFREDRRLDVALNGAASATVCLIPQIATYSQELELLPGWNHLEFMSPDGCDRPIEVEENSLDSRCLSLRFSNVNLTQEDTQE